MFGKEGHQVNEEARQDPALVFSVRVDLLALHTYRAQYWLNDMIRDCEHAWYSRMHILR